MRSFSLPRRRFSRTIAFVTAVLLTAGLVEGARLTAAPKAAHAAAVAPVSAGPVSRPDEVSAVLAARLLHRQVLIQSLSTDSSDTYVNANGTYTLQSAAQPYQALVGKVWQPIDTNLAVLNGAVRPNVAEGSPVLSAGGTGPLASITADGSRVSWSWPTALPAPTLAGDTATYANVGGVAVPGENLQVTATPTGFEIHVILTIAPTTLLPVAVPLTVSAPGLTVARDAGGGLHLKNAHGAEVAASASPVVYDHSGLTGTQHAPILGTVTTAFAAGALSYSIPAAFLRAPSTVYPVTLDPGVNVTLSRAHWTVVDSGNASTSYYDSGTPQVGTANAGTNKFRSFYQFNTGPIVGKHILSATVNLNIASSGAVCSTPTEYDLYASSGFTSSTTWSNQPTAGTAYGAFTSAAGDGNVSCPAGVQSLTGSGPLGLVQSWATASNAAGAAEFKAANETTNTYYKSLGNNPTISVTYNSIPAQTSGQAVSPCLFACSSSVQTNSLTPTLSSQATDADGGTLTHYFEVYAGSSGSPTTLVASGSATVTSPATAQWTVPSSTLTNGSTYEYRTRAYDGTDYGPWSGYDVFTVDTTAPATPTVTTTGFTAGSWAASGTTGSFSYSDASTDTTDFQWRLDTVSRVKFLGQIRLFLGGGPGLRGRR